MALKGIRVLEFAGLAPAPFCGMILADFGATVIRIDKANNQGMDIDYLSNGKSCLGVDIKHPDGVKVIRALSKSADVLIEPFRAGVMEKLGLGPEVLMKENKRLVYARLTGYGQGGEFAHMAGHDINFISLSGLLSMFRWGGGKPIPPVNLAADFGGGGLLCTLGIVMALLDRSTSGLGQIVDCSMTQGSAYLASWLYRSRCLPIWQESTGSSLLDGGAPHYNTYETSDGKWMAVGCLEPQFFSKFVEGLGLTREEIEETTDMTLWQTRAKSIIENKFKQHPQEYWIKVFKNLDACVTPILERDEAVGEFVLSVEGCRTPCPTPTLSRTPAKSLADTPRPTPDNTILLRLGYTPQQLKDLISRGILSPSDKSKL